jgi:hypothetical protein
MAMDVMVFPVYIAYPGHAICDRLSSNFGMNGFSYAHMTSWLMAEIITNVPGRIKSSRCHREN